MLWTQWPRYDGSRSAAKKFALITLATEAETAGGPPVGGEARTAYLNAARLTDARRLCTSCGHARLSKRASSTNFLLAASLLRTKRSLVFSTLQWETDFANFVIGC